MRDELYADVSATAAAAAWITILAKLTVCSELIIRASGKSSEIVRGFGPVPFDPADTGQDQTSSGALWRPPAALITAMRGIVPF